MKKNPDFLYRFFRPLLKFLVWFLFRPKMVNQEVLNEGPLLIVANHRTILDPIFILASTKRTVHFFAKVELVRGLKKHLFNKTGLIAVDRKAKNPESFKMASLYLENGEIVGIFPEGTRNQSSDKLLPLKVGAAKLAVDNKVKIVLAIQTGEVKLFSRSLKLEFSKPIDLSNQKVDEAIRIIKNEMETMITDRG